MISPQKITSTRIEVKFSKNNLPVPLVNGIQLHSLYAPEQEAKRMAEEFYKANSNKENILVLGLGLAYHIEALQACYEFYSKKIDILVIEPEEAVYKLYLDLKGIPNFQIYSYTAPSSFYDNKNLIDFLCKSPAVFKHIPTFSNNVEFFKSFLSYKSENTLKEFLHINKNEKQLAEKLKQLSPQTHILEFANFETIGKESFLFRILNSIGNQVKKAEL